MHKNGLAIKEFIVSIYVSLFGPQFFTLFIFFFFKLINLFLAVLGLRCCEGFSSPGEGKRL